MFSLCDKIAARLNLSDFKESREKQRPNVKKKILVVAGEPNPGPWMSWKRQTRKQLPAGQEGLDGLTHQDFLPRPTVSDAAVFGDMPTLVYCCFDTFSQPVRIQFSFILLAMRALQGAFNNKRTIWENTERSHDAEIFKKKYQSCNKIIHGSGGVTFAFKTPV